MADDGAELAALLGVDEAQGRELAAYMASMKNAVEVRSHLGSLLPDSAKGRAFIEKVAKRAGGAKAREVSAPAAAVKVSVVKKAAKHKAAAPVPKVQVVRGINHNEASAEYNASKLITGNEPSAAEAKFQNCLDCGMIYLQQAYAARSRCAFCDEPLGRAQLKKHRNHEVGDEDAALAAALAHRDKLLDFDASSASRTKVLDDQSDYYELDASALGSKWVDDAERAKVRADMERQRDQAEETSKKVFLTFDLAGRRVVQDQGLTGTASEVYARLSAALS